MGPRPRDDCHRSVFNRGDRPGGPGTDVCSLATEVEFQKARGINPAIGMIPAILRC